MTDSELIDSVRDIVHGAALAPGSLYRPGESLARIANLLLIHSSEQVTPPAPAPVSTVRVRIAVAVNEQGEWSAHGADDETDRDSIDTASDVFVPSLCRISFVEANVPLPTPQAKSVIEGTVKSKEHAR